MQAGPLPTEFSSLPFIDWRFGKCSVMSMEWWRFMVATSVTQFVVWSHSGEPLETSDLVCCRNKNDVWPNCCWTGFADFVSCIDTLYMQQGCHGHISKLKSVIDFGVMNLWRKAAIANCYNHKPCVIHILLGSCFSWCFILSRWTICRRAAMATFQD